MAVTYVAIARIPVAGIEDFRRYEAEVLPLLEAHGGHLERRLRNAAGDVEVHVIAFASPAGFAAYRDDPRRAAHRPLLEASGARTEVLAVEDVATG
jgi:uncharacterized protein (DUF1330 family)